MNWITTNIRLPEDQYNELKMIAAQDRKSIAELLRSGADLILKVKNRTVKKRTDILMKELEKIAKRNAKALKGESLSEALIKMRYEQ